MGTPCVSLKSLRIGVSAIRIDSLFKTMGTPCVSLKSLRIGVRYVAVNVHALFICVLRAPPSSSSAGELKICHYFSAELIGNIMIYNRFSASVHLYTFK
jgi:hypothetical protein